MKEIPFHYPPEVLELLVETIARLFRSKKGVLVFFRGAGVPERLIHDLDSQLRMDRNSLTKFEIARTVLARLNAEGDALLQPRRELIRRIAQFDDFSSCWPDDENEVRGLVARVREVVNIKDSFTRMSIEREHERQQRRIEHQTAIAELQRRKHTLNAVKNDLFSLFAEVNPHSRGKRLETVLNSLFQASDILIREAFTVRGVEGEGVIEQIDGVVEIDGSLYLVEMKWWDTPLGVGDVSQHLVRIYHRGHARGIFISTSGYTDPAVTTCREALAKTTVVLCTLDEIVALLEQERDLKAMLQLKIQAAIVDKNPLHRCA